MRAATHSRRVSAPSDSQYVVGIGVVAVEFSDEVARLVCDNLVGLEASTRAQRSVDGHDFACLAVSEDLRPLVISGLLL